MSNILTLHRKAMALAQQAVATRFDGDQERYKLLIKEAFEHESAAAELLSGKLDAEPTRAVLHRSAAWLAFEAGQLREAERIAARGLAGFPPEEIANQLRDLHDRINFHRHLRLHGIRLMPWDFQIVMTGNAIGSGIAPADEFFSRIEPTRKLFLRTAERKAGRPFRESGRFPKEISRGYEFYLEAPRSGSFAVTVRIGLVEQLRIPGTGPNSTELIEEVMACFDMFQGEKDEELRQLIDDEHYYRNFVALAKQIAPDGDKVKMVGFTAILPDGPKRVQITRRRKTIPATRRTGEEDTGTELVRVTGQLKYADELAKHHKIRIVEQSGKTHQIVVPYGMMSDIVRPLWGETVTIVGSRGDNGNIILEDIQKQDD